jgi:hypothetical protein
VSSHIREATGTIDTFCAWRLIASDDPLDCDPDRTTPIHYFDPALEVCRCGAVTWSQAAANAQAGRAIAVARVGKASRPGNVLARLWAWLRSRRPIDSVCATCHCPISRLPCEWCSPPWLKSAD